MEMNFYFSVVASCFSIPCRPSVTLLITIFSAVSPANKATNFVLDSLQNDHCTCSAI